jgi:amino acid adenylation domain-containing protein
VNLLQQHVTAQAERSPDSIAIKMNGEAVTYGALEQSTNQLARLLRDAGCSSGDRICLIMPKSAAAIMSIVGVLKAGCIYVPIDPASPVVRVKRIVESCEPTCILAAGPTALMLDELFKQPDLSSIRVGWMANQPHPGRNFASDFSLSDVHSQSGEPIECQGSPTDVAHILFTSGSTGIPKGVAITHANVNHFLDWALCYFKTAASDRISSHPPLHFDLSTFDIFGTFAAGAQLHLVPAELNLLAHKLAQFIRDSEITQWFSVPSILTYMASFDVVRFNDFPRLKRLLSCGEVLPTRTLMYWMTRLPHVTFTNLYGPTETTVASSFYTVRRLPQDESAPVPIGAPCDGEKLLILDEASQPVPKGGVGDLYIGGVGLSPGYWRDTEKTNAVFVKRRNGNGTFDRIYRTGDLAKVGDDGLIYFIGRSDSQIKCRGYRIELGEIEAALNSLVCLKESAAISIPNEAFDGNSICCAYVSSSQDTVSSETIRMALSRVLPRYMMPSLLQQFDLLPRNSNGKIDRRALKEHFQLLNSAAAKVA